MGAKLGRWGLETGVSGVSLLFLSRFKWGLMCQIIVIFADTMCLQY